MKKIIIIPMLCIMAFGVSAQSNTHQTESLPEQEISKLKYSMMAQIWGRYTEFNEGSLIDGIEENDLYDFSIRRFRASISSNISNKWYFCGVFGLNNINSRSNLTGIHVLDLLAEYEFSNWLYIGIGKNGHTGPSRLASVSSSTILGADMPIFGLSTINLTDHALRKNGMYIKGEWRKLSYRLMVAKPNRVSSPMEIHEYAEFRPGDPSLQSSGYFKIQFLNRENIRSPYSVGSYLGKNKVVNIGFGFLHQPNTTWTKIMGDTLNYDMKQFAADIFIDMPLRNSKSTAITALATYHLTNFGPGYLRNIGVNNLATSSDGTTFNGSGNAYPTIGTGEVFFGQIGVWQKVSGNNGSIEAIQPYLSVMHANYERLNNLMVHVDAGINIFFDGHNSKLTFGIQNRPVFYTDLKESGSINEKFRKNMLIIQYQIKIKS